MRKACVVVFGALAVLAGTASIVFWARVVALVFSK